MSEDTVRLIRIESKLTKLMLACGLDTHGLPPSDTPRTPRSKERIPACRAHDFDFETHQPIVEEKP